MLRTITPARFMPAAFFLSLLGAGFATWSAWGNAIDLCFTAGCTIYQDTTVAGISMWWAGTAAFCLLALLAVIGRSGPALFISGIILGIDCLLLLLLALTTSCVSCLIVGIFFALTYAAFRSAAPPERARPATSGLLLVWSFLFVGNLLAVARNETGTWPIKQAEDPYMNFYFSPSCSACQEGLRAFSGRTDVSFYPVAKTESDVSAISIMNRALARGMSMAEALKHASEAPSSPDSRFYSPETLRLRFALIRNKAHALNSGGGILPFVEYLGLPQAGISGVVPKPSTRPATDSSLPIQSGPTSCAAGASCP